MPSDTFENSLRMKTMSRAVLFSAILSGFGLVSCASVSKTLASVPSKVSHLSEMAVNKISPAGVKVVEVREKDLKKLPTGQERALAFENTHARKRSFWFFNGPVDFKEPTLPSPGGEMDGSLLPPKSP